MNCAKIQKLTLLKQSGELNPKQMQQVDLHLASCPECREYAENIQVVTLKTRGILKDLRVSPTTTEKIVASARINPSKKTISFLPAFVYTPAIAAILFLAFSLWSTLVTRESFNPEEKIHTIIGVLAEEEFEPLTEAADGRKKQIQQIADDLIRLEGLAWENGV